jgi:hypothetical protein
LPTKLAADLKRGDGVDKTPSEDAAQRASARVEFQLTYARCESRREIEPGRLSGPEIADAYRTGEKAPGDWEDGDDARYVDYDEDGWINRYASYAVTEAIHEALEWFRVDGKPWLNPHGLAENRIYKLTNKLCADLAELRREVLADSQKTEGRP